MTEFQFWILIYAFTGLFAVLGFMFFVMFKGLPDNSNLKQA
jgi:hypothetical protein